MYDTGQPDRTSAAKSNVRVFSWPLSKDVSAEVRLSGGEIRSSHLEHLRKYLELAKDAMESEEEE